MLFLLILTSVTVITLDFRGQGGGIISAVRSTARDALAPVQGATSRALQPVGNFFSGIGRSGELKAENARLRRALERARGDSARVHDLEIQQRQLVGLEHLDFADGIPTRAARVIAISPSNFELTVTIDKGSDAGVTAGMPVVSNAGLVGRIVQTSRSQATVLLLTDRSSNVGVRFRRPLDAESGAVGVARGDGAHKPMPVELVDVSTPVERGDLAVTSGLQQSVFPPDIPVGRVTSARVEHGALQQDIDVEPLVDGSRLEFLKVLLWERP